ncbi:MAG: SDR family oxidoreductase [Bacteroidota bacterium]
MNVKFLTKSVVVCGSTQGIGKATALEFARNGANLVLIARNEEKLKETINQLDISEGQKHSYLVADFSKPEELKTVIQNYIADGGDCHVLVNNTGGPKGGLILEASIDEFQNTFTQHLICNHILVQNLVPLMKKNEYGRIINIISTSVKQPLPNLGVSNTIRGAVASWSKTLATELAPFKITVNNVLPGATNTIRLQGIAEAKSQKTNESVADIFKEMAAESPIGRIAEPEEVANVIVFLASPAASYINGINVPVDGGRTKSL